MVFIDPSNWSVTEFDLDILTETYGLVQSLSKNEKGHFKRLNASNKKTSKLVLAFDILSGEPKFNKGGLLSRLEAEQIGKHVLRDLTNSILRALSLFNAKSSATFQLNLTLSNVESLFSKKRFKLCNAYLDKGLRLAQSHGEETYALKFSFWKRRLEGLLAIPMMEPYEEWRLRDQKQLELVRDKLRLHHLGGVQTRILLSEVGTDEILTELETKVLSDPILGAEYDRDSLENLFLHNGIRIRCLLIAGNLEKALSECQRLFDKVKDEQFEGRMISNYFVLRLNIMRLQAFLKLFDAYTKNRLELEALLKGDMYQKHIKLLKPVVYPSFPIIHCAYLAKKGETEYLINYHNAFIENPEYTQTVDDLTHIEVGLLHAWSLFVEGKFKQSFNRIALLNADFEMKNFEKLNSLSKWLELLACYEMRDDSLFHSRSNSLYHYLQVKTQSSEVEHSLIKHLNATFSNSDRSKDFKDLISSGTMDFKRLRMTFSFIGVDGWILDKSRGL